MKITLYTEEDCPDCIELKKVDASKCCALPVNCDVYKSEVKIPKTVRMNFIDLIKEHDLPPWVPTAVIEDGDRTIFVCSSNKTGNKGNIYIADEPEIMLNQIKEIVGS